MFSDLFGIKPKKGKSNDALTDFINNILNNNNASVTIKINSARSQNQRDVNGNMVSESMDEGYPDRTQELLRDLGMAQVGLGAGLDQGIMQKLLGGMSNPVGNGMMQTDLLANMLRNPQQAPTMPYNAQQIPLQQLLQLARGGMTAPQPPQAPQMPADMAALLGQMPPAPVPGMPQADPNVAAMAQQGGQQLPPPTGGLMGGEEPVDPNIMRQLMSAFK